MNEKVRKTKLKRKKKKKGVRKIGIEKGRKENKETRGNT